MADDHESGSETDQTVMLRPQSLPADESGKHNHIAAVHIFGILPNMRLNLHEDTSSSALQMQLGAGLCNRTYEMSERSDP